MITGGDEEQAESYEIQLKAKLDNNEIPKCTKYDTTSIIVMCVVNDIVDSSYQVYKIIKICIQYIIDYCKMFS